MNNSFYPNQNQNPFPSVMPNQGTQPPITNMPSFPQTPGQIPTQPQYAENLLEKNVGKQASFYMSYSDSIEWRDRIFTGIIEDAGRDYALLHDTNTGERIILWTVYLNFVIFNEPINH